MIARVVMVAVTMLAVGAHPHSKERTPPPPPVRLGPVLFPGTGGDSETAASGVRPSHAAVECGKVEGVEKSKSCNNHCQLLRREYKGGDCIEGRCICKKEAEKVTCDESCTSHCKSLGQDGRCVEGVCHCHDVELECEYHESCSSHCLTLGHTESRCHEGICRCGVISHKSEKRPTIKCSELVSVGKEGRNRQELCYAHCRREGYRRGECEKEICNCSI